MAFFLSRAAAPTAIAPIPGTEVDIAGLWPFDAEGHAVSGAWATVQFYYERLCSETRREGWKPYLDFIQHDGQPGVAGQPVERQLSETCD